MMVVVVPKGFYVMMGQGNYGEVMGTRQVASRRTDRNPDMME